MSDDEQVRAELRRAAIQIQRRLGEGQAGLLEVTALAHALIDLLVEKGLVGGAELEGAIARAETRLRRDGPGLPYAVDAGPLDGDAARPEAEIDCAARLHLCRAACCSLTVSLSEDDIEAGCLAWDAGQPFALRRDADHRCAHLERATGRCLAYERRPRACRAFTCRGDGRIWRDFEAGLPNEKGIAAILGHEVWRPLGLARPKSGLPRPPR